MLIVHIFFWGGEGKKYVRPLERIVLTFCVVSPPSLGACPLKHCLALHSQSFQPVSGVRTTQCRPPHGHPNPTDVLSLSLFCNQLFSILYNKHFLQKPKDWMFCRELGLRVGGGVGWRPVRGRGLASPEGAAQRESMGKDRQEGCPHAHSLSEVWALNHTQSFPGGQTGPLGGH